MISHMHLSAAISINCSLNSNKRINVFCKNIYIFDWANVFVTEAISARDEESLVKTAFPLGNENTGECSWATVEEQDHGFWLESPTLPATALPQSTLPPHFRHSSLILKTTVAMSSAKRIVVRSVTVIYTKMFARTWCNTGCLFEELNLNFNRKICHKSSHRRSDISLTQQQKKHGVCPTIYFSAVLNPKLFLMFLGRHPTHAEKLQHQRGHYGGGGWWDTSAPAFALFNQRTGVMHRIYLCSRAHMLSYY